MGKIFLPSPRNMRLRSISEASIVMQTYRGTRRGDKFIQKVMLPYQTLIPYFLKKVNFYLEKGIVKSENDTLPIKMVDELPQQTQCDCRAFVYAFAEYVIHGRDIPKEIEIGHIRMRFCSARIYGCLSSPKQNLLILRGVVIKSFMSSGTTHDDVLPTGRISPWSTIYSTPSSLTTNLVA
ncbi:hypothetical protein T459_19829 [Capsicum annuum]|uniref:Ubiquitin-like protease family profile domain-containing protein n=1 Tax=Capsicum annuum TaxID=4072 RepID=A0A2G2Z2R9_CAPAN|nr:hypothetical protein T459_19829 [Capsicum annuum]